jgi:predicted CXXCH cytochrome family protein
MGAGVLDPRNGQSMDCLSCHGLHEAPAEKYLYSDGGRELCVGCHKDKGVPR